MPDGGTARAGVAARGAVTNVVFAGLGGQGVIKASDVLADVAFRAGLDVKKAEIHGMSQRGGSVTSDVRFGPEVLSPMIPEGEADFLVVLAPTQVENNLHVLRKGGVLFTPDLVAEGGLPNRRSLNVALLGGLAHHLPFPDPLWHAAIRAALPERLHDVNFRAFETGRAAARARAAA
jgi:indolepyruvate ferredoxin oxidoreductase beta subunit